MILEIRGFFVHWKEILFEIMVFKIKSFICVPNCIGKRGEISFVRDKGEFEITVFEVAGVDHSAFIGGILSQFKPSKKAQLQQFPGASPPRTLPGLCSGPVSGLTAPPPYTASCLGEENDSENSPCLPLHPKCPISATDDRGLEA